MRIQNLFQDQQDLIQPNPYPQYEIPDSGTTTRDLTAQPHVEHLLSEHILDIYIQDKLTIRLTCTAVNLPELVLGRLLSEGIIRSAEDVDLLYICQTGHRARVFLNHMEHPESASSGAFNESEESFVELTPTCCTGTRVLNQDFVQDLPFSKVRLTDWDLKFIQDCDHFLKTDFPLHNISGSTHAAGLFHKRKWYCMYEDIGRHNAIDKAIGRALIDGLDLSRCAIYTTGRMPVDVIQKVIRSGIPLIAGKETPTVESLQLAVSCDLTVIGKIRNGHYTLYSGRPPVTEVLPDQLRTDF